MAQADQGAGGDGRVDTLKQKARPIGPVEQSILAAARQPKREMTDLMFNPEADISRGRVHDIVTPMPSVPQPTGDRPGIEQQMLSLLSGDDRRFGDEPGEPFRYPAEELSTRDAARNRVYGDQPGEPLLKRVSDELGMKAGAITTVDLEAEQVGPRFGEPWSPNSEWNKIFEKARANTPEAKPDIGPKKIKASDAERSEIIEELQARLRNQRGAPASWSDEAGQQPQVTEEMIQEELQNRAEGDEAREDLLAGIKATRQGVNMGGSVERTRAMTAEEFLKLTPRQKAAVELNSMLIAAIEADTPNMGAVPKNKEGKEYQASVEALFSGEGKTAAYAPNTVEVLKNIGWQGTATNLDDILSGKLGFTRQDLGRIDDGHARPDIATPVRLRESLQESLVKAFVDARKESVPGDNLLAGKQELLGYAERPGFSTAPARKITPDVDVNDYMRQALDIMADSNSEFTPEQVLEQAGKTLTETEFASFLDFLDTSSRDSKSYRQPLGADRTKAYLDPVEFRKSLAGLLRKERSDGLR